MSVSQAGKTAGPVQGKVRLSVFVFVVCQLLVRPAFQRHEERDDDPPHIGRASLEKMTLFRISLPILSLIHDAVLLPLEG